VDEALALLGALRRELPRERGDEVRGEADRVDEDVLRVAGVHGAPPEPHARLERRERLVLDLARGAAVERVRDLRPERLEVDVVDAVTDLLVRGEHDAHRAARDLGVADEVPDGGHDLGDAGLVVRAEQRGAVAGDELVTGVVRELRPLDRVEHLLGVARKRVRAALVVEHLRLHVLAAHVGRGVDVRDEADRRRVRVPGQRAVDDPVLGELRLEAELLELRHEHAREVELPFRARRRFRVGVGGGVHLRVAHEPVARVGPELARELAAVAVVAHARDRS
jgi:hypothetical protein